MILYDNIINIIVRLVMISIDYMFIRSMIVYLLAKYIQKRFRP